MSRRSSVKFYKKFKFALTNLSRLENIDFFSFSNQTMMKVLPLIGIDMSKYNMFDEKYHHSYHDRHDDQPSIYERLITHFLKSIKFFSAEFTLPYCFGCKASEETHTADCYAVSGDYYNPQVTTDDLSELYKETVDTVIPSRPCNHGGIFEMVHKLTRRVHLNQFPYYFVHLHIATGKMHDLDNVIEQVKNNVDNPVSIIIVKLNYEQQAESEMSMQNQSNSFDDLMKSIHQLQTRTRFFVSLFEIDVSAQDDEIQELMRKITWRIISHIEHYITIKRFQLEETVLAPENTVLLTTPNALIKSPGSRNRTILGVPSIHDKSQTTGHNCSDSSLLSYIICGIEKERSKLEEQVLAEGRFSGSFNMNTLKTPENNKLTALVSHMKYQQLVKSSL